MMKIHLIWITIMVLLFAGCAKKVKPVEEVKDEVETVEEVIPELTVYDWQQNDELIKEGKAVRMVVVKEKRVLVLFDKHGDVLSRHRISLGENPIGTKLKMGDKKTPEGVYRIRDIRPDKKYYNEILISYPNSEDIKRSKALGFNPGGGITFHAQVPWNWDGRGDDHTLANDWTNGCVALTNHGMDTVLKMIDKHTVVEIRE
jgi:murein L,D-transpeptidase YafK